MLDTVKGQKSNHLQVIPVSAKLAHQNYLHFMLFSRRIMNPHETPSVSIDGHAIRRIREEKRLTQLYVAKVVGVTTDTVSRWENNRYPTIRRDNALKLAEALEVELEDVLKRNEEPDEEIQGKSSRQVWPIISLILFLLIGSGWLLLMQGSDVPEPTLQAERLLPRYAAPGSRVLVRVQITMEQPLKGVIVKEQLPDGWNLIAAVPQVSSVASHGIARWMLRNPQPQTTISYLLEVDASAETGSQVHISGEVIANSDGQQSSIPIVSVEKIQIAPLHWVDADGNQVIDDMEILEISDLFDDSEELRSEWERIEAIWDVGGYQWDEKTRKFIPLREK